MKRLSSQLIIGFVLLLIINPLNLTYASTTISQELDGNGKVSPETNVQVGHNFTLIVSKFLRGDDGVMTTMTMNIFGVGWSMRYTIISTPNETGIGVVKIDFIDPQGNDGISETINNSWYWWGSSYVYSDYESWKTYLTSSTFNSVTTQSLHPVKTTVETVFKESENAFGAVITTINEATPVRDGQSFPSKYIDIKERWYDKKTGMLVKLYDETQNTYTDDKGNTHTETTIMERINENFDFGVIYDENTDSLGALNLLNWVFMIFILSSVMLVRKQILKVK